MPQSDTLYGTKKLNSHAQSIRIEQKFINESVLTARSRSRGFRGWPDAHSRTCHPNTINGTPVNGSACPAAETKCASSNRTDLCLHRRIASANHNLHIYTFSI